MTSAQIRSAFLDFFRAHGHEVVASSSLVPHNDPTLLFTNAGMNQFKDVFLGLESRPYRRATTSQKCVRAGGKHNDLENVGFTARHHTFFEMLGNFSFGDYFKAQAIQFAWELLTVTLGLDKKRLWVTVYAEDDEAHAIWTNEIGLASERVIRIGDNKGARYASDNFWMMGDTGPCGPCTEIFFDHGESIAGGPPGSPGEDGDRFIEIWNNVFMQYNRDASGQLQPLPKPSVDTGMGLERMAAVLQGVHSNYQTDGFVRLIAAAKALTSASDADQASLNVLADHIRACSFLLADGVIPGNEGRGFVLRRIIRRAVRHGYKLGVRQAFFYRLADELVADMGAAYPELIRRHGYISDCLRDEEQRFLATIDNGMSVLNAAIATLPAGGEIAGDFAFRLHDTYGFPLDLTQSICREAGYRVDESGFTAAMDAQRQLARRAGQFTMPAHLDYHGADNRFVGYHELSQSATKVLALYRDGQAVDSLSEGERGVVVLAQTPFYAEAGGQCGDQGRLIGSNAFFAVDDTQVLRQQVYGHIGVVTTGRLALGETVNAEVDVAERQATARHHSATHLLHKALREVLGDHVEQKGSQVDAEKTRFDFSHPRPLSEGERYDIERRVNRQILANTPTDVRLLPIAEAEKLGAMMLFGEKYGDTVRVVDIGNSRELCGGTHVGRSGDLGFFRIVGESAVAAGIRRIEAVCAEVALAQSQHEQQLLQRLAEQCRVAVDELPSRLQALQVAEQQHSKTIAQLKQRLAVSEVDELIAKAVQVGETQVIAELVDDSDTDHLRLLLDRLKSRLPSLIAVLASRQGGRALLAVGVTKSLVGRYPAGPLLQHVLAQVGGKGGGRPDLATGSGERPESLPAALKSVLPWVESQA